MFASGREFGSGPAQAHYKSSVMGSAPVPFHSVQGSFSVRLGNVLSGTDPHGSGYDPVSMSMGLVGSRSVRLGYDPSGSGPSLSLATIQVRQALGIAPAGSGAGPVWLGGSVSGPAPAQVRRVWNSRFVWLGDVTSAAGPRGPAPI